MPNHKETHQVRSRSTATVDTKEEKGMFDATPVYQTGSSQPTTMPKKYRYAKPQRERTKWRSRSTATVDTQEERKLY